jgi:hypothetical protein
MSWRASATATRHCLTGCAIGEIAGIVLGAALGWTNTVTLIVAIALAFAFGYALTARHLASHMTLAQAARIALLADTVSIAVMELVDNTVIVAIPGAMSAHIDEPLLWTSLALSLAAAFLVAWPVNHWLIARGQGHALHHAHHGHDHGHSHVH